MISKCYIVKILRDLDAGYRRSSSSKKALYYSKLAIIELCGWIEESMDDVVSRCAHRNLKQAKNIKFITDKVIKMNHGFTYKENFKGMLIKVLGLITVEKIESSANPLVKARFESHLAALKLVRDSEAHTHLKKFTRTIDAPSVTLARFSALYDGLKEFDSLIKKHVG